MLSDAYAATRQRIASLVSDLDDAATARQVPACPEWTVHDLVAHVSGIPEAITSGDLPGADQQAWLDGLVDARRDVPIPELLERWEACADATAAMIDNGVSLIVVDLVCHEHDLRAAVAQPGARGAAEVRAIIQPLLETLLPGIKKRGTGALMVDSDGVQWASHVGRPACTLHVDPWEACRALGSRRTADELRALPRTGNIEPFIGVIADHLPLPQTSLGEA